MKYIKEYKSDDSGLTKNKLDVLFAELLEDYNSKSDIGIVGTNGFYYRLAFELPDKSNFV